MKFLFVCIGNSCRSQIAEAIAKDLGYNAVSAGTKPALNVHKNALLALFYKGINTKGLYPKPLKDVDTKDRIVVSMGCGVECPDIKIDYDFGLEDPKDLINDLKRSLKSTVVWSKFFINLFIFYFLNI